jgi:endonuclease/exonuclease/phosphatase family metal-dependent hydrolase
MVPGILVRVRSRAARAPLPTRVAAAALVVATALGFPLGSGCGSSAPTGSSSASGTGGSGVDFNGTTGAGDEALNGDLGGETDPTDPAQPNCAPDSIIDDMGNCVPSCFESGSWCGEDDPTTCDGWPAIQAFDCTVCCAIPDDMQGCPPGGCDDPDCPPGEDCSYSDTCPDGTCAEDEDCTSCPIDCGACAPACGDGVCDDGFESCSDCPDDCGACAASCGDGVCNTDATPAETCESCPEDCGNCLKVLTWDINAGQKKGKSRVKQTLKSIADLIRLEKPDFVGLESVDKGTKRSGGVDQALYIAKRVKMYKRFGGAFKYDGGQYGLGFLSKFPIAGMSKTNMSTSGEWAKRRILLTASLDPPDYYTNFHLGVTQLAHQDAARLAQATIIANDLGFEADSLLVGDLFEGPSGPAVQKLQQSVNLLDLWTKFGTGAGLTTAKSRFDYVMAGLNWWNQAGAGSCATVIRTYVKPAKGLSSHRPVIAVLQRGYQGIDCGATGDSGGDDTGELGSGDSDCVDDEDCSADPVYRFCLEGYCSECRSDDDCADPDAPTCGGAHLCL